MCRFQNHKERLHFLLNGRLSPWFYFANKEAPVERIQDLTSLASVTCSVSAAFILGFPDPSGEKISFLSTLEEISQQMTMFSVPMVYNNERITLGLIATRTFYMYNMQTCKETLLKSGRLHAEQLRTIFTMSGPPEAAVQPREHFSQSRFLLFP